MYTEVVEVTESAPEAKRLNSKQRRRLMVLERRLLHLMERGAERSEKARSFDEAEIVALAWTLKIVHRHFGLVWIDPRGEDAGEKTDAETP